MMVQFVFMFTQILEVSFALFDYIFIHSPFYYVTVYFIVTYVLFIIYPIIECMFHNGRHLA